MAEATAAVEVEAGAVAEGRRGRAMYHGHKSRGHGGWPGRTPCVQTARYAAQPTMRRGEGMRARGHQCAERGERGGCGRRS